MGEWLIMQLALDDTCFPPCMLSSDEKPGAPPRKMTVVEVFGDRKAVEIAERM